jgi:outer membrane lipoprotein-sorting protein
VALAEVLANVEQVQAFMYKMTMHVKTNMPDVPASESNVDGSMLIANDYGMRMDMKTVLPGLGQTMDQQMYMLPQQKMIMVLMPALKKYMRMQVNDELFEKKRQENNDPRLMLKKILECQYTDLGKTVLHGVEVQGFQTTDPAYTNGLGDVDVKVWVNRKTGLPVRVDMKIKMGEQMEVEGTLHDFEWEVPVSAAEFNPVIPPDFTAGPGDGMKMPAMTEETALDGLKLCLEMNGKYPDDLNLMTLMQAASKSFQDSAALEAAKSREPKDMTVIIEEQSKKALEKMMPIQALGGFYMILKQEGNEPVYYGKMVTPGDIAQVLLRWKTGEDEYRVIFADLHAATVDAETLAKLEAGLPR